MCIFRLVCLSLCLHKLAITHHFGIDVLAFHQVAELAEEKVDGSTIGYQMMEVEQQIARLGSVYDFETEKWVLIQIERLHKLPLFMFDVLLT